MPLPKRNADCHPELRHAAHGFCDTCYAAWRRAQPSCPPRDRTKDADASREWRKRNLDSTRATKRKQRYGISRQQQEHLYLKQAGRCAICVTGLAEQMDHDHKTNKVRGYLCKQCNRGLGHFRDNPALLLEAVKYLQRNSTAVEQAQDNQWTLPRK